MGYALIVAETGEGRYTIQFDWGEAQRAALAAAATTAIAVLNAQLAQQQAIVDANDAAEAELRQSLADLFNVILDQLAEDPRGAGAAQKLFADQLLRLGKLQAQHRPARVALSTLKATRAKGVATLTKWNNLQCLETRNAWCCDFTAGAAGYVATVEIPGESNLVLIAPAARPWVASDGLMTARPLMSPEQVYFNAAILPGWQKDFPTYRWGTITRIDFDAETVDVALGEALSSAQRLNVNVSSTLSDVPVHYMTCGVRSFSPDDRVLIQFVGQDWGSPSIVGYLDTPRICPPKFAGTIPAQTAVPDEFFSVSISSYWTLGKEPRLYEVIQGTLPAGLSLNSATGLISGTATDEDDDQTGIVVRCSDAFYEAGSNRRYDDSTAFDISVDPGLTFYDGTLDLISFAASSGTRSVSVLVLSAVGGGPPEEPGYIPPEYNGFFAQTSYDGTGTPPTVDRFAFCQYLNTRSRPDLYARFTYTGDAPTSGDSVASWVLIDTGGLEWEWGATVGVTREAAYEIEIAKDAAGTDIVATVTGSAYVQTF